MVLNPSLGEQVVALSANYPVWIIDSPLNKPVVHQLWRQAKKNDLSLTIFNKIQGVSVEHQLLGMLFTIDEHHGETSFCSKKAYTRLTVLGLPPTQEVEERLAEVGFVVYNGFPAGFSAVKRADKSV